MDLAIKFEITTASNSTEVSSTSRSPTPAALQFVFGVLGNLIAIIALFTAKKKHKWRPFYRLVLGLTLTDGLGILLFFSNNFSSICFKFQDRFPYLRVQLFHVHIHIDIICNDCLRNVF